MRLKKSIGNYFHKNFRDEISRLTRKHGASVAGAVHMYGIPALELIRMHGRPAAEAIHKCGLPAIDAIRKHGVAAADEILKNGLPAAVAIFGKHGKLTIEVGRKNPKIYPLVNQTNPDFVKKLLLDVKNRSKPAIKEWKLSLDA